MCEINYIDNFVRKNCWHTLLSINVNKWGTPNTTLYRVCVNEFREIILCVIVVGTCYYIQMLINVHSLFFKGGIK